MYRQTNSHSGFTLVELLVAIGLFTIIVAIAVGGFTNALRTQRQVSSLIATESNVSLALEQMTREMRTGYLFCHDPAPGSTSVTPSPSCGVCSISDSNYGPPVQPYDSSEEVNGDLPVWTCTAIDYYTADGTHVNYSVDPNTHQLMRTVSVVNPDGSVTATPQPITGQNVYIHNLSFVLFGNVEGDNWTPRITIAIGASPNSTDLATENDILNLQTTVSSRIIDCVQGTDSC